MTIKILVIDDEMYFTSVLAKAFERRGYAVECANTFDHALTAYDYFKPDWCLVDLKLKEKLGTDLLHHFQSNRTKVIILTGFGSISSAIYSIKSGAVDYLTKPVSADEIIQAFLKNDKQDNQRGSSHVLASKVPSLDRMEWEYINKIYHDCNCNITKASKVLGIHRRSLQRKLSKSGGIK